MAAKVNQAKKQIVNDFAKLAQEYPIVGAVNMEGMPTPQLQTMRTQLRKDEVVLKMTKKRLLKLALEKADKKGLEKIIPYLKGQPALIFTKENPFKLFKNLEKNKSSAPAKAGQIAPKDIVVEAGPTPFAPGPVIGELGAIGIKAGIDAGKVAIKEEAIVVKEGEEIPANVAAILQRLGIEPMEIGLDLTATIEDGEIFTKETLNINEDEYINNILNGHRWSFNLAMEAGIYNDLTTEVLITKAEFEATILSVSQNILADKTIPSILAKAESQMQSLKALVPESVKEEPKPEEKLEEKPEAEEQKENAKEETSKEEKEKTPTQSSETASADEPEVQSPPSEDKKDNEGGDSSANLEA
ncbi:50S ribosomal protein L10 [Candidatus Woesearchaeota archaeon]|nr:50S ribosomal protein L10 [Candidatus Woesearchaeota archaeon]